MKKPLKKPKLPRGFKIKVSYVSNEYTNFISWNKDEVSFALWDGISEHPTHILKFPRI